jgi:hypothetical protein
MTILPIPGPSIGIKKKAGITSAHCLNTTPTAEVKQQPSMIPTISSNINQYWQELQTLLDLQAELDNADREN